MLSKIVISGILTRKIISSRSHVPAVILFDLFTHKKPPAKTSTVRDWCVCVCVCVGVCVCVMCACVCVCVCVVSTQL